MVGCTEVSADHVVERRRQVWQVFADGEGADWRSGRPGSGRNGRECRVVRPLDERPVADGGARRGVHHPLPDRLHRRRLIGKLDDPVGRHAGTDGGLTLNLTYDHRERRMGGRDRLVAGHPRGIVAADDEPIRRRPDRPAEVHDLGTIVRDEIAVVRCQRWSSSPGISSWNVVRT